MHRVSISRVSISRVENGFLVNGEWKWVRDARHRVSTEKGISRVVNGNGLETRGIASLLNLNSEKGIFRTFRDESTTVS
ncbi:MAG: hypothetical protein VSS75_028735 [Candidatus Parabeggiatoa sp.]|nr:hypothetical protein [Candidatus Parabeggiatoa sp.]